MARALHGWGIKLAEPQIHYLISRIFIRALAKGEGFGADVINHILNESGEGLSDLFYQPKTLTNLFCIKLNAGIVWRAS